MSDSKKVTDWDTDTERVRQTDLDRQWDRQRRIKRDRETDIDSYRERVRDKTHRDTQNKHAYGAFNMAHSTRFRFWIANETHCTSEYLKIFYYALVFLNFNLFHWRKPGFRVHVGFYLQFLFLHFSCFCFISSIGH